MSSNFQIVTSLENDGLHLQMLGEVDGSAACDLINRLEEGHTQASQVIVETSNLRSVHPFGKNVFENRIGRLSKTRSRLFFTGKNKHYFQP